ncbi:MAG: iron chelate uptake ABC transporter family permease subunit, partial [Nitrososphaerota archaeon]|nr:iron chelate uptake ABC transporter family permease subunit [Nitrososphaerota archaeon]
MLFVSFLSSVLVGSVRLPPEHVLMHLFGLSRDSALLGAVVDLRVVRAAAAVLTGVSLGVAGAMLQSLFRNPLADPFIL